MTLDPDILNPAPTVTPAHTADEAEKAILAHPQVDCPLIHRFAPGIYIREILMPANTIIVGHSHKTEHFNIILAGGAMVAIDGQVQDIMAPATFISHAGVRKVLMVYEDMIWQTVHAVDTAPIEYFSQGDLSQLRDDDARKFVESIEGGLVEKSAAWLEENQHRIDGDIKKLKGVF